MTRITQRQFESIIVGTVMNSLYGSVEVAAVAEMKLISILRREGLQP